MLSECSLSIATLPQHPLPAPFPANLGQPYRREWLEFVPQTELATTLPQHPLPAPFPEYEYEHEHEYEYEYEYEYEHEYEYEYEYEYE